MPTTPVRHKYLVGKGGNITTDIDGVRTRIKAGDEIWLTEVQATGRAFSKRLTRLTKDGEGKVAASDVRNDKVAKPSVAPAAEPSIKDWTFIHDTEPETVISLMSELTEDELKALRDEEMKAARPRKLIFNTANDRIRTLALARGRDVRAANIAAEKAAEAEASAAADDGDEAEVVDAEPEPETVVEPETEPDEPPAKVRPPTKSAKPVAKPAAKPGKPLPKKVGRR